MAVIRFKTNILCEDKPGPGSSWMMWADNHAKRRYLDATRLSIATYVCFVPCMDMCVFYICIYYYTYIYMTWTPRERPELRALTAPAIFPAAGADQNFRYRLDIMTRSRNYWILRRTAGYIAARDLKGKKKRSARNAHAVARKSTVASQPRWVGEKKRSAESLSSNLRYGDSRPTIMPVIFLDWWSAANYPSVCCFIRLKNKYFLVILFRFYKILLWFYLLLIF